jgi:hypothetical protein
MDGLGWLVTELLVQERQRGAREATQRARAASRQGGLKRSIAASIVRLGLRLDAGAAESVQATQATFARQGGGC